jgi:AraC-like DNA-binding protein
MKIIRSAQSWQMLGFGYVVNASLESLALSKGYRVDSFCHALGVSECYLRELFLRDMGLTPKEWMQWERMVVARRMLAWGLDSMEVAHFLGYSNPGSFYRTFRKVYGVSPLKFLEGPPVESF